MPSMRTDEINRTIEGECCAILNYLNDFVGKPFDQLPSMAAMFARQTELFEGRYAPLSKDAFRTKIDDRLRLIHLRPDVFGNVGLFGTVDNKTTFGMDENGVWKNTTKGKAIRYGILEKFVSTEIPHALGEAALSSLSFLQKLGEEVYLPTLYDFRTILEAFKRKFGIEGSDEIPRNPFLLPDPRSGRSQCDLLHYPIDGCSVIRESEAFLDKDGTTFFDKTFRRVMECFLAKEMLRVHYKRPGGGERVYVLDPIVVSVVMKHGGVYLTGAVWDEKQNRYWTRSKDSKSLRVQTCKIDRIVAIHDAGIRSTLTKRQFDEAAMNVRTNDGTFYVPPEDRFDAVIKVSPTYAYYEESVPFRSESAKSKLDQESLAKLGQPPGAACYLIQKTNSEHLINEVVKSRGNIVVLSPAWAVDMVRDEMERILKCQSLVEPKGVALVEFPGYKGAHDANSLARIGDLPSEVPVDLN